MERARALVRRIRTLAPRAPGEDGQAMVEFAVTLPIFLLLIMGVIYFGRSYYMDQSVRHAARYVAWKTARHSDMDLSGSESRARQYFLIPDADIQGSKETSNLDEVDLFTSELLEGFGDPGSLPSIFDFSASVINGLIAAGLAQVSTEYHVTVRESWSASWFAGLGGTDVERTHHVAFSEWTKDEIYGDEIILAFEAVLDAWAYANITSL